MYVLWVCMYVCFMGMYVCFIGVVKIEARLALELSRLSSVSLLHCRIV